MGRQALISQAIGKSFPRKNAVHLGAIRTIIPWAVLLIAISAIAAVFLYPNYREFPMDDAYIHFVYAQNLADHGMLYFNHPSDQGLGTTSLFWVGLLAAGMKMGLSVHFLAKFLGIASLAVASVVVFHLLRPFLSLRASVLIAFLLALSGNLLWFALSGMETMLFLAIGCLALLIYCRERWGLLGILLGILTLTRPEGVLLGIALAILELFRQKRFPRGILISGIVAFLICSPWFIYLQMRTGHFLPTSATGKMFTNQVAMEYALDQNTVSSIFLSVPALLYIMLWVTYLVEFGLGGAALPGPHLPAGRLIGNDEYTISVWAVFGLGVFLFIFYLAWTHINKPGRWVDRAQDSSLRPILAFIIWAVLHNLAYMILLPLPGTASRYGAINYLALWMAVIVGLDSLPGRSPRKKWITGAVILIVAANTAYWNQVYDANLLHMHNVRIKAAHFVRESSPQAMKCAAADIGALRYFGEQPLLDLGALVNPEAIDWYLKGAIDEYLLNQGINCLILPGRSGARDEGWLDVADILGLSTSSLLKINPVAVFEIDRETWLRGYLPTNNYQASVVVYQVEK